MSITIGWWALPLAVTVGTLAWSATAPPPRGWGDLGEGFFRLIAAVIASLVAWLAWAVLT